MRRRQDLHLTSVRKNFLQKIVCRRQVVAEHGEIIFRLYLFLGMMQRQGPEVFFLSPIYLQIDSLRWTVVFMDDSETVIEILFGTEILWQDKSVSCRQKLLNL